LPQFQVIDFTRDYRQGCGQLLRIWKKRLKPSMRRKLAIAKVVGEDDNDIGDRAASRSLPRNSLRHDSAAADKEQTPANAAHAKKPSFCSVESTPRHPANRWVACFGGLCCTHLFVIRGREACPRSTMVSLSLAGRSWGITESRKPPGPIYRLFKPPRAANI
jgi:hypothetical protein